MSGHSHWSKIKRAKASTDARRGRVWSKLAKRIIVAGTHGVLCGPAVERLAGAPIDHLAVTDTVPIPGQVRSQLKNLTLLTVSELLGEAIRRIHRNESVSSLFMK